MAETGGRDRGRGGDRGQRRRRGIGSQRSRGSSRAARGTRGRGKSCPPDECILAKGANRGTTEPVLGDHNRTHKLFLTIMYVQ